MKAPLINRIAANLMQVCWTMTTVSLWGGYLYWLYQQLGSFSFYYQMPVVFLHILILVVLVGAAFFVQIPLLLILAVLLRNVNKCDFSVGNQVTLLKGKHKNTLGTVAEVSQGQGGPKHHVIIIDEKDIPTEEERFFEESEVGPPELLAEGRIRRRWQGIWRAITSMVIQNKKRLKYAGFLTGIVAILIAMWFSVKELYTYRLKQDFWEHNIVKDAIRAPNYWLIFAEQLSAVEKGEISEEEFDQTIEKRLLAGILTMYFHLDKAQDIVVHHEMENGYKWRTVYNQPRKIKDFTGRSLYLLGIKSSEEFNRALQANQIFMSQSMEEKILDGSQSINQAFSEFLEECIRKHEREMAHRKRMENFKDKQKESDGTANGEAAPDRD